MSHDQVPMLPISSPQTLRQCRNLRLRAGDVFIASYPKSGTTWTQNIVFQLLAHERGVELTHISDFAPFFEVDATWPEPKPRRHEPGEPTLDLTGGPQPLVPGVSRLGRRIFNTHLPWPMMPRRGSDDARYLYLVRDGRDVVTSFFHHLRNQALEDGGFDGSWADFFTRWLAGDMPFGRWRDHLVSWLGADQQPTLPDPRVLIVRYEDLKRDLPAQVARIATHIRAPFAPGTDTAAELLERMSFDYMKRHLALFKPRSVRWRAGTDFQFVRKGQVGDHASLFTDEQRRAFERAMVAGGPAYIRQWLRA